jgi:hypothetical protein
MLVERAHQMSMMIMAQLVLSGRRFGRLLLLPARRHQASDERKLAVRISHKNVGKPAITGIVR